MVFITPQYRTTSESNSYNVSLDKGQSKQGSYENIRNYGSMSVTFYSPGDDTISEITISFADDIVGTNEITKQFVFKGKLSTEVVSDFIKVDIKATNGNLSGKIQTVYERANTTGSSSLPQEDIPYDQELKHIKSLLTARENNGTHKTLKSTGNALNVHLVNTEGVSESTDTKITVESSGNYLFASKQTTTNDPVGFDTMLVCAGGVKYSSGFPHTFLTVSNPEDKVIRQQHGYNIYTPGSHLISYISGIIKTPSSNVTSRIGYFDDASDKTTDTLKTGDGYFFQYKNGNMYVVSRASNSDDQTNPIVSQIDTEITQSNWNLNTLDGTIPNGDNTGTPVVNIDFQKRQTFIIKINPDFTILFGVLYENSIIYCHKHVHTNFNDYPCRLSLPVRYEVSGLTGLNSTQTITQFNSHCVSNLTIPDDINFPMYSYGMTTALSLDSEECIMAIKLNNLDNYPKRPRVKLRINKINFLCTTNGNIVYTIYKFRSPDYYGNDVIKPSTVSNKRPTTIVWRNGHTDKSMRDSAASITDTPTYLSVPFNKGSSGSSNGPEEEVDYNTYPYVILERGYFSNNTDQLVTDFRYDIKSDINGNSDILAISCYTIGSKESVLCSMQWFELE